MAITVITEFPNKATVRIIVYVYNDTDVLTAPTSVLVSIWDPDGGDPVVDESEIVVTGAVETGIYAYYYHMNASADAMMAGQWRGEILVIDGAGATAVISPGSFSFKVR